MEQIIITKKNGTKVPLVNRRKVTQIKSAKQTMTLLGDDVVDVSIDSPYAQTYEVGDQITVFGRVYKLNQLPKVKKTGMREFSYDLQFEGVQYDLLCATYDLTIDTTTNELQDVQADSLTGDLRRFTTVMIANACRVFPGKWVLGTCPDTKTITLTFSETDNCLSVLQNLCSESNFNIEFEIAQNAGVNTVNFKKVGQIFPYTFQFGRGKGLYSLDRQNVSSSSIVTRLKVQGSSDNITSKYRAQRLCLPGKTKAQSFIEKDDAVAKYGIIEGKKFFDDIKPTFNGSVTGIFSDSVLKFVDTKMFDLNTLEDDGVTTKYLIDGTSAKVHFNTGNLAGYEFEVNAYDHATHTFTLTKQTDDRGDVFPSSSSIAFQFAVGNEYKLIDVALPDTYAQAAETELANVGNTYYDQNSQPKVQYGLSITKFFLKKMVGNGSTDNIFQPGDYIPVEDADIDVDKSVRIQSLSRNLLDEYDYSLTISDTVTTNITNRVISELVDIDKVVQMNNLKNPAHARANWRSSREVMNMVFDPDGDYYSDKIKPNSIDTLALSVGAKSMQFALDNTVLQPNYQGDKNSVKVTGGVLTHYTIVEDGVRSWILGDKIAILRSDSISCYIYASCSRSGTDGYIIFSTKIIKVDEDVNYYHFLLGVINSVDAETQTRSIYLQYGFSMINGRFIKTGRIESADGTTYFDLDNSEIGGRIVFSNNGTTKTLAELGAEALETKNYINNTLPGILSNLQSQNDGQIEQWFYSVDPTGSSEPNSEWATTTLKDNHLGDLYYNTSSNKVWRYIKTTNNNVTTYSWSQLSNEETSQALSTANEALALARTKQRIFTSTPYTPYEIGDLWAQGADGDILKCKTSRLTGAFTSSDWNVASKYTDDSAINEFINGIYVADKADMLNQIDGKIESWFQSTDPATSWSADELKSRHAGDTWFDTAKNTLRFFKNTQLSGLASLFTRQSFYIWKGAAPTLTFANEAQLHIGDIYAATNGIVYIFNSSLQWVGIADENQNYIAAALCSKLTNGAHAYIDSSIPSSNYPWKINDVWVSPLGVYVCNNARLSNGLQSDWTSLGSAIYCWQRTYDKTAIDAYNKAASAKDTADGKRRVFVATPVVPYDIGDLWVDGTQLRRCATAKTTVQTYNVGDWITCVKYDNTKTVIDGGLVTSGTIQVAGSESTILAGITGQGTATDSIRFWAGVAFEDRATAPFRVMQDGSVVMTKATVEGIINAISGSIGGFSISQGRIGNEYNSDSGLALYNSFIRFKSTNKFAAIGNLGVFGYDNLAKFCLMSNSNSDTLGSALFAQCRGGDGTMDYLLPQRALEIDGNVYGSGKRCFFEEGYIGQAYTDTITGRFHITHKFHFTANTTSYLSVNLPTKSMVDSQTGNKVVMFDVEIACDRGMANRLAIKSQTGAQIYDNDGGTIEYINMEKGDTLRLRYYNGGYHILFKTY